MRCYVCKGGRVACYWYHATRARVVCECGWIGMSFDPSTPAHRKTACSLPVAYRLPRIDAVLLLSTGRRRTV